MYIYVIFFFPIRGAAFKQLEADITEIRNKSESYKEEQGSNKVIPAVDSV